FSSRRRHTRSKRDWSSDVCSSDLIEEVMAYTDQLEHPYLEAEDLGMALFKFSNGSYGLIEGTTNVYPKNLEETLYIFGQIGTARSEERRVGKESDRPTVSDEKIQQ